MEIENRVQQGIRERIERENAAVKQGIMEAAKEEGFQQGLRAGLEEERGRLKEATRQLNISCQMVLNEQKNILSAHEKQWCRALAYILKRFMVASADRPIAEIRRWLSDSVDCSFLNSKVKIFLPTRDYEVLRQSEATGNDAKFQLVADDTLAEGEIRCESDMGGVIFAPFEQVTGLEEDYKAPL